MKMNRLMTAIVLLFAAHAELIAQGGYVGIDPADVARGLNAISDGLWADLLVLPDTFDLEAAKRIKREAKPDAEFVFINPKTNKPYGDIKKAFSAACRKAGTRWRAMSSGFMNSCACAGWLAPSRI